MSQLVVFKNGVESSYFLNKRMTTIGSEALHDIVAPSGIKGIAFSILMDGTTGCEIIPGSVSVKHNGSILKKRTFLHSCDQLEWDTNRAVYLNGISAIQKEGSSPTIQHSTRRPFELLQNIFASLQTETALPTAFKTLMDSLIELSGAEDGTLLAGLNDQDGWQIVASTQLNSNTHTEHRRAVFSNRILSEARRTKAPVYIESTIGNPIADSKSVIDARIFSAACFPLLLGQKVFGCVLLHTRTPGKVIHRDHLTELSVLATQATFLLLCSSELSKTRYENIKLRSLNVSSTLSSRNKAFSDVIGKIQKIAATPLDVLILGETGSGKEVVAKEIHRLSSRKNGPFVSINCAAIPATLLESILFGHEKGSFTGAIKSQKGKFETANGGTLLLDEVGELAPELQSKLLRVLQERKVEPLGSNESKSIDVRVLTATHRNLAQSVKSGEFRQDLYFRINGATLQLPPLRDRPEDIEDLSLLFATRSKPGSKLSLGAIEKLKSHSWPGNVRELQQTIERSVLLSENEILESNDIELTDLGMTPKASVDFGSGSLLSEFETLEQAQSAFTQSWVKRVLDECGGNRTKAAERLGVSERTLYRLLSAKTDG